MGGLIEQLRRAVEPLQTRVLNMIARAVVDTVDDKGRMQELKLLVLARDVADKVERFQNYGLTSSPLPGAEAVVVFLGGSREHPIAIAVDDRQVRPKNLEPGEVLLYTDELDFLHFKRGNLVELVTEALEKQVDTERTAASTSIEFTVGTSSIKIEAGKITLTADAVDIVTP